MMENGENEISTHVLREIINSEDRSANDLWYKLGNRLMFYPVHEIELQDLFIEEGLEWNEPNLAKFLLRMIGFFKGYDYEYGSIDRKIVRDIAHER